MVSSGVWCFWRNSILGGGESTLLFSWHFLHVQAYADQKSCYWLPTNCQPTDEKSKHRQLGKHYDGPILHRVVGSLLAYMPWVFIGFAIGALLESYGAFVGYYSLMSDFHWKLHVQPRRDSMATRGLLSSMVCTEKIQIGSNVDIWTISSSGGRRAQNFVNDAEIERWLHLG